jgi:hypothetical protein
MRLAGRLLLAVAAASFLGPAPAAASTSVQIDGSYFVTIVKPDWTGARCSSGAGDECGVMQFVGLGPADYVYVYGPTFEPTGKKGCFDIDGTFTITLHSDGSTISGPLTGVFCGPGGSHAQAGTPSYGNPQGENDTIDFADGTGQFAGLHGTAAFSERTAGAWFAGTLTGSLGA